MEGREMVIIIQNPNFIIQNPNFLAHLITEGIRLAIDNYTNQIWLNNILNPLAPALAPTNFFHNMQYIWNQPSHFNPIVKPMRPDLSFTHTHTYIYIYGITV